MIPDQIEQWESAAERNYDEAIQPGGKFQCTCGSLFDPEKEGGLPTPNPYGMPVCGQCLGDIMLTQQQESSAEDAARGLHEDPDLFSAECWPEEEGDK